MVKLFIDYVMVVRILLRNKLLRRTLPRQASRQDVRTVGSLAHPIPNLAPATKVERGDVGSKFVLTEKKLLQENSKSYNNYSLIFSFEVFIEAIKIRLSSVHLSSNVLSW